MTHPTSTTTTPTRLPGHIPFPARRDHNLGLPDLTHHEMMDMLKFARDRYYEEAMVARVSPIEPRDFCMRPTPPGTIAAAALHVVTTFANWYHQARQHDYCQQLTEYGITPILEEAHRPHPGPDGSGLFGAVLLLLAPFRQHPDYDPRWTPAGT